MLLLVPLLVLLLVLQLVLPLVLLLSLFPPPEPPAPCPPWAAYGHPSKLALHEPFHIILLQHSCDLGHRGALDVVRTRCRFSMW